MARKLLERIRLHDAGIKVTLNHIPPYQFPITKLIPVLISLIALFPMFFNIYGRKTIFRTETIRNRLYAFRPIALFIAELPASHIIYTVKNDMTMHMSCIIVNCIDCFISFSKIFLHKLSYNLKSGIRCNLSFLKGYNQMIPLSFICLSKLEFQCHYYSKPCTDKSIVQGHLGNNTGQLRYLGVSWWK